MSLYAASRGMPDALPGLNKTQEASYILLRKSECTRAAGRNQTIKAASCRRRAARLMAKADIATPTLMPILFMRAEAARYDALSFASGAQ